MKNFKIETLDWKWAPTVKRPEVHRPDEYIHTSTKEEALESSEFLLNQPKGLTYTITVLRDGEFYTYYRHSQPCLGSLCKYKDHHGDRYYMNPYLPRDIRVAFPEGEVVYIGICLQGIKKTMAHPHYDFLFSEESPWVAAFGHRDTVIFRDNYLIFTNSDADPTVFYSLMRLGGLMNGVYGGVPKSDLHPKVGILLGKTNQADPRRLAGQLPIKTSGGSWKDGWGYSRPLCEHIFKTDLPVKSLKDFAKFPNNTYPPNPPFTNKYFVDTMKEKFGIDISKPDKKAHEVLLESWDFFREEAKNLKYVLEH